MNTAIRNMTPDDLLAEAAGDSAKARWSTMESLTATLIDEVRQLAWVYASAHTDQAIPKPEPIKRPGISGARRKLKRISIVDARRLDPRLRGLSDTEAQTKLDRLTGRRPSNGN